MDNMNDCSREKYKGMVPQENGNWGAQIYANNQRIWLGTFKSKMAAAIAYDRASIKLRNPNAPRNFPWTLEEAKFQSYYTKETILTLIKDGSYQAIFDDFQRHNTNPNPNPQKGCGFSCRSLFQKELTPSDVGKLNRLVIPKKYAVQYFPPAPDESQGVEVHLSFYDTQKRLWKFRYCYWKSSQSFVFTRGWNEFVKEYTLRAKDKIAFYYYEDLEMPNAGFWVIDVNFASLNLDLGRKDEKMDVEISPTSGVKTKGFKLFGVQICS